MAHDFAPPTEQPPTYAPPAGTASGARAGFWRRFGAAFVDGLVIALPINVLVAAFPDAIVALNALSILVQAVYFTLLEGGRSGQTLGKQALGIRVVDLQGGGSIGYGRAFVRYLGRFVSTIVFLLGYLWMLWDREKQTWHDKMAGSVVVPA
jgi:uncharacterized RDD family membrane protein YckC